jgi:hypothetical protein
MKTPRLLLLITTLITLLGMPALRGQDRPAPDRGDRLERLERRVNEMAERQEQFMRRLGNVMEQRNQRRPAAELAPRQPAPPAAAPIGQPLAKAAKGISDWLGLLFILGVLCNILLAVWIYTDIRKRNEGSGLFVALAIFAGIPAALIYALTRIGDKKA